MAKKKEQKKIYVLDTSVILHDHNSILNFQEHDIAIPITVLEELDNFKRGNDTKNYEARQFIRILDGLSDKRAVNDWVPLNGTTKGKFKIVMPNGTPSKDAEKTFGAKKADHLILNAAVSLQDKNKDRDVVLVTKDVNLRIKAKALDVSAEDYKTGKIKDLSELYTGKSEIDDTPDKVIKDIYKNGFSEDTDFLGDKLIANNYYILKDGRSSSLSWYNAHTNRLEKIDKSYCYGIKPRNAEQAFAIHAITNDNVKLVTVQGMAGTGKTLLALAGSLEQKNKFGQIIMARPIVALSNKDLGYLPGSAEEKIGPYMQPLFDNLNFIKSQFGENEKKHKAITQLIEDEKIVISPLAYIRGRSLSNVLFIIDEAQNLTPHEVKTIITRAGENTKLIFTGDINQIDTPYLDENSNGLSYIIDRLKGAKLFAHITLEKGERSELANLANDLL